MNAKSTNTNEVSRLFEWAGIDYSTYRPTYPNELGQALANLARNQNLALDVGCGTGQLTTVLSQHFTHVIGTDINKSQLEHATQADNITYIESAAEKTDLEDSTIDLIVVAQAAHWFDLELFYKEAKRLATPNSVIALVSYGVPYIESSINSIFQQGYWQLVHRYWPAERKHVENGYIDLPFPFEEIELTD